MLVGLHRQHPSSQHIQQTPDTQCDRPDHLRHRQSARRPLRNQDVIILLMNIEGGFYNDLNFRGRLNCII